MYGSSLSRAVHRHTRSLAVDSCLVTLKFSPTPLHSAPELPLYNDGMYGTGIDVWSAGEELRLLSMEAGPWLWHQ